MFDWLVWIGAFALFLLGLRLSAFFSGNETGFYRLSFPRLSIDAHGGDRVAQRLLWLARNPSYFVATTLIGNNVANYLTTFSIGLGAVALFQVEADWLEIVATLCLSPLIFIFAELIPKNLYYRAPMFLVRRDSALFIFFYWLFLPVSFPLIWVTKLLEKLGGVNHKPVDAVLGRKYLAQVLSRGHQEGVLTDVQSRLVYGLLHTAAQRVTDIMTPANRILGVSETATHDEIIDYARQYGLSNIAIRREGTEEEWYGYVRLADVFVSPKPTSALIRKMPRISPSMSKLEALLTLRKAGEANGLVVDEERILGLASERGLVEQLFRTPSPISPRLQPS